MTTVKTIGTGSGLGITPDYATIALWESYLNGLGAFSDDQVGRLCWASSANQMTTGGETFDGSAPGSYTIILESGDSSGNVGGSFRDNADKTTNALVYNASNGAALLCNGGSPALTINDPNITVRYLQIKKTGNYNDVISALTADTGKVLDSCIVQFSTAGNTTNLVSIRDATIRNNLILLTNTNSTGTRGIACPSGAGTSAIYNNAIVNTKGTSSRLGIMKNYAGDTITARNNALYGWSVDWSGSTSNVTASNNATDLTSGTTSTLPGSSNQYDLVGSTEWESVSNGAEDFRLKSSSAKCKDNGSSTGTPTVDIIGQARSGNYDIGCWEYQSAPPAGGGEVQAWNMIVRLGA